MLRVRNALILFMSCLAIGGILAGCGNASTSSKEVKTTKQVAASEQESSVQSSSTKEDESKSESTDESTDGDMESGNITDLRTVGQSIDDEDYGIITLINTFNGDTTKEHGKTTVSFNDFQVLKFEPKDKDQRDFSDFEHVGQKYYVLRFKMNVKNNDTKKLLVQGLSEIDLNSTSADQSLQVEDDGATDADAEISVNPGVTKSVVIEVLLTESQVQSLNKISLTIGEIDNKSYDTETEESDPINIPLD